MKTFSVEGTSNITVERGRSYQCYLDPISSICFRRGFVSFSPKSFSVAVRSSGLNGVNHGY